MSNIPLRIHDRIAESIVDGEGIRYVLFVQGCPHHCPGCHNPQTHDFAGGTDADEAEILREIREDPLLAGVTFSGGEPFCQPAACARIARHVHEMGLNVVTYTGYTLEELQAMRLNEVDELLAQTDVLIDGRYMKEERDLRLHFRGSRNQRILDCNDLRRRGILKSR